MIRIRHLNKIFNEKTVNEKRAIDDLSLNVDDGDFICMIGANGSGKSTLLQCLSGALISESGSILMDGKDITLDSQHQRADQIGHLFQDPLAGTAPHMSVEENLALAAKTGGWFSLIGKNDRKLFREKLASLDMGLEDKLDVGVGTLSGGMRQALALVMNTIRRPKLLLLDEHTAALDLGNRLIMMHEGKIILDLNKEEKEKLSVEDLIAMFRSKTKEDLLNDRMLLS